MPLNTDYNFHQADTKFFRTYRPGDDFYEALIDMHQGLSDEDSERVNTRLILLLANHIGDLSVLKEAMKLAREDP